MKLYGKIVNLIYRFVLYKLNQRIFGNKNQKGCYRDSRGVLED